MKLMELYKNMTMGAISGWDRIRFRGTLRWLANNDGLRTFMKHSHILLKDFSGWVEGLTEMLRQSCKMKAEKLGIEFRYLRSSGIDKENLARQIAKSNGIKEGSICMFSVVETCIAPMVRGNKASKKLELTMEHRKCVHVYHYFDDPEFGFGNVRIQSWLPFNVHICLNGRHWLEKQMHKSGIDYVKDGNCFPWIKDIEESQKLLDKQLASDWAKLLNRLTLDSCPILPKLLQPYYPEYYWSADETEWATDIMFNSVDSLDRLYPLLLHHGLRISDSPSIMKYLGKRNISLSGRTKEKKARDIMTDCRRFYEGVRLKHWFNCNSVKMYNKSGSILRIETTINNTRDFKVFRHPEDDENRPMSWLRMRKGVSDLHRRSQVSQQCNERYSDAIAAAQVNEKLKEVAGSACNKVCKQGKKYRGLNPWQDEDYRLLMFLSKGENAINGFRNKDMRKCLYPESEKVDKKQLIKFSGRITRRIKLLRIHGLIRKVPRANRYVLTEKGQKFSCALITASTVDIKALTEIAA